MERAKDTDKDCLKHGLARVFLFYAFGIFFLSQFDPFVFRESKKSLLRVDFSGDIATAWCKWEFTV